MHFLFPSFFGLQLLLSMQVATAQVPAQKPKKTLAVTDTPQTSPPKKGATIKAEWIPAYSMSYLDDQNDQQQMVLMVPTNLKMVRENYLGVFTTPVSKAMNSQFSNFLAPREGLLVNFVHAQSPAAIAGCKPYDILVSINKTKLKSSQQLREIVIEHSPNRKLHLKLIRTAKLQTVELTLAKRKMLSNVAVLESKNNITSGSLAPLKGTASYKFGHTRGLYYAPVDYRLNGKKIVRGNWIFVKQNANHLKTSALVSATTTRSISVETHDGSHFVVGWNTTNQSHSLKGTLSELRKKNSALPKEFQVMVKRNLEVAELTLKNNKHQSIVVNVKPRLVGKNYVLRFNMIHPSVINGKNTFRCFEIDHVYSLEKPVRMSELLTLKLLNSELKKMKASYRNAVVAMLKKLPAPKVKVEIENSQ